MREIDINIVIETVKNASIKANMYMPEDLVDCILCAKNQEKQELPKFVIDCMLQNLDAAKELSVPICQDTGMAVIFAEVGQDVHFIGGDFEEAINEGVRQGYNEGFLRKSIVSDPIRRENTGDNTPAILHTKIVKGDKLELIVAPKGFGSENMSSIKMMLPTSTQQEIMDFIIDTVKKAGSNPCPPIVLGVGIGGDFEYCAYLAKKALCRNVSERNTDEFYASMEEQLLKDINSLNIGPQGFGGVSTALSVNIETAPTHIAGLPVAVNVGCHVTRHLKVII